MSEPTQHVMPTDRLERPPDRFDERLVRAGFYLAEDRLDLGERFLTIGENSGE